MPVTPGLPELSLAGYRCQFRAARPCRFDEDPRGLWHGVFGLHLHRLACVLPGQDCATCALLHQCGYPFLFTGPRPPDAELMRRYDRIPVPHVLHIDADFPPTLPAGADAAIWFTLIGTANERLPLAIAALRAAAAGGLGARRDRLELIAVEQWLPDADAPLPVWTDPAGWRPPAPPRAPLLPPLPPATDRLLMEFLTPWQSGAGRDFAIGSLLMAIVRRVSLLQYFYTGRRLDADFPALKAASEQVQLLSHGLHRQRAARYAARHRERLDLSGLVGTLELAIDDALAPLWPYLHLGQWLHVGKNASMGFGAYRLSAVPFQPLESGP